MPCLSSMAIGSCRNYRAYLVTIIISPPVITVVQAMVVLYFGGRPEPSFSQSYPLMTLLQHDFDPFKLPDILSIRGKTVWTSMCHNNNNLYIILFIVVLLSENLTSRERCSPTRFFPPTNTDTKPWPARKQRKLVGPETSANKFISSNS